jgi:hypothetical protein
MKQESHTRVVNMEDDDPEALDAFIAYLHTSSTLPIENWGVQSIDPSNTCRFNTILPERYFVFLIEVYRLADKYDQPLLAKFISKLFHHAAGLYHGKDPTCEQCGELSRHYERHQTDPIRALAAAETLPDSKLKDNISQSLYDIIHDNCLFRIKVDSSDPDAQTTLKKHEEELDELFAQYPAVARKLLVRGAPLYQAGMKNHSMTSDESKDCISRKRRRVKEEAEDED